MASSNVIIRKCEGQGINVQDLNGLAYSGTKQDVMISRRFMHTYIYRDGVYFYHLQNI